MASARRAALWVLAVVFTANFFSYLDRQVASALEHELTEEFKFSSATFGFLWTAFTLGYMTFAPVVGYFTDRASRPRILAACVALWSLATLSSGWATSTLTLIVSRFFIGIGEAGCLVIGPTLLADTFSREARGKALAAFFLALPLGGTAGYVVTGYMVKFFGWREAFYVAGYPGFVIAALIWFLADPPRGATDHLDGAHAPVKAKGWRPYLPLLRNRTLLFTILAQAFAVIILVPLIHFGVGFLQTKHGMQKTEATNLLGAISLVAGVAGNVLSGAIGDRLARRTKGAYALLAGFGYGAGLPFMLVGFLTGDKTVMALSLGAGAFCYFLCMPAVNTQIANAVGPEQRAMAYAMAVFILHLMGDTGAPVLFGWVSKAEHLGKETAFVVFSLALLPASLCCFLAARAASKTASAP